MISAKITTGPIKQALGDLERRSDRATMWATREVGRDVKRMARRTAPVYQPTARTTLHGPSKPKAGVVPGLLRDSIRPSRRLRKTRDGYILKIGPRGQRVHLYAGKAEAVHPFMAVAYAYAVGRSRVTYERGWARAMKR